MHDANWDELDPEHTRLRKLVEGVDREIAVAFSRGGAHEAPRLVEAWQKLVSGLALRAAPELRRCPFCERNVPSIATRCRYCLRSSDATPSASAASASRER